MDDIIGQIMKIWQAKSLIEWIVLAVAAAFLWLLASKVNDQIKRLKAVSSEINASAKTAEGAAGKTENAKNLIEEARLATEETLRQLGMATNQIRAASDELRDLIEETNENPRLTAIINLMGSSKAVANDQLPEPATVQNEDHWEEFSTEWRKAKDFIESRLELIQDGRVLRKYANISRHTHKELIDTLVQDRVLAPNAGSIAKQMNDTYLSYRTRKKPVSKRTLEEFKSELKSLLAVDKKLAAAE
jgi:hypothetical protein